jgi:hypothetical protein
MKFPVIELVDRFAIARVKSKKTNRANQEELEFYIEQLNNLDLSKIDNELQELFDIHWTIWGLESELKSGREDELSLEEIGRRALLIRDWNNKRVTLKNKIAEILDDSVREIKVDHASQ